VKEGDILFVCHPLKQPGKRENEVPRPKGRGFCQSLQPDGVSTDGHRGNRAGPVYDLPTTMAKLIALGFSLNQVVEMATLNAARLLGRPKELGTLRIGQPADISVLRLEDREWTAIDSQKGAIPAKQALVPVYAIRRDTIYKALPAERP